jgi:uncharacterized membrane protein
VPPKQKRSELDHLAEFYSLDERGVESMFAAADARPSRAEGLRFLALCLRVAGILALAAGIIFFVAANWSRLGIFGRFALVQLVLVGCAIIAVVRPPPSFAGRAALFLAWVSTGALLALFGQTYQTGADVYELFLTWSLLGLPLVLIARWGVTSAGWVVVFNTMLLLYCGWQPAGGMLWALLGESRVSPAWILMGACWLNLLLWFAAEWRRWPAVPDWVRRILVSAAFGFCTWSGLMGLFDDHHVDGVGFTRGEPLTVLASLATMGVVGLYAYHVRKDIYPLSVVVGSFIIVGFGGVIRIFDNLSEGLLLVCALWLIGSSTVGGKWLVSLMRRWRDEART